MNGEPRPRPRNRAVLLLLLVPLIAVLVPEIYNRSSPSIGARCGSRSSCLRRTPSPPGCAPRALIAFVKDILIYVMVLVAVIYIPYKLGGYDVIFHGAQSALAAKGMSTLLSGSQYLGYTTLALGSALALFLYPHAVTGVLASHSRDVVKKNMSLLPA